jgi:hypothetical protein
MPNLSVAIICKNNQSTIGSVLESVRPLVEGGGEIVAVDSGSTDNTLEMLRAAGARIIQTQWRGHIATKQLAMDACEREWILSLDSDEPVQADLQAAILKALANPDADGYRVNRKVWYKGRALNHAWQPEWRLRLVRRGKARWGGIDPHDKLDLIGPGTIRDLAGTLRHDSFETFIEHLGRQANYARISAQGLAQRGERGSVWRLVTSPFGAFAKQLLVKSAWRDGMPGWLAAATAAAGALMKHAALIEITRTGEAPRGRT